MKGAASSDYWGVHPAARPHLLCVRGTVSTSPSWYRSRLARPA